MLLGNGAGLKFGDHGDIDPYQISVAIESVVRPTAPTAQGRRKGLRSPACPKIGNARSATTASSGKPMMTRVSMLGGISARIAKNHRKYQSGRGSAWMLVGSALAPRLAGPTIIARASTTTPTARAKMTSLQAASGQKG